MRMRAARSARAKTALAAEVEVTYYTDPLCSWSWAFEPQWRRLRYEFGERLACHAVMGGLLASWDAYDDPINMVSRPVQMGPLWFQVRHVAGMPLDERIWYDDPPATSYPSCVAYYAAAAQGAAAGERYLRRMREAVMLERRNIARREVLVALAHEVAAAHVSAAHATPFNAERFAADLDAPEAAMAFRADLMAERYRRIERFPSLVLRRRNQQGRTLLITGYRPYAVLRAALAHLAPDLQPVRHARDAETYRDYWGGALEREIAEALEDQPASPDHSWI